jgi:hypothetical protein
MRPGYLADFSEDESSLSTILQILARQAARWTTAARQDKSPMIAILHANYGAGYLWAMQDIATTKEIEAATGIDWKRFKKDILLAQDQAAEKMAKLCPKVVPNNGSYLTKIAREG